MKKNSRLIPTLFTIPALIILLILGSWQVKRLVWKNNLISEISERVALEPVPIPAGKIDLDSMKYRRFTVKGHFLHDKEIHLFTGPKEMRGKEGYNIFTPLEGADGTVILVDRGWVPATKKDPSNRPETLLKGEITLIGMLQAGEHKGMFMPPNDVEKNLWFWIDMNQAASFTGKALDNVYVRALENGDKDALPIPGKNIVEIRNDHLQYAVIWYSFAVILAVIYTIYIRGLEASGTAQKPKKKVAAKKVTGKKAATKKTTKPVGKKPKPKKTKSKVNGKL